MDAASTANIPTTDAADPSCRFVAPVGAPYLANMAALWGVDPKLAAAIEQTERKPSYSIEGDPAEDAALVAGLPIDRRFLFFRPRFGLGDRVEGVCAPAR